MTNAEKARAMRAAIDAMETAMMGWPELIDLPEKWGEPRHHDGMAQEAAARRSHEASRGSPPCSSVLNNLATLQGFSVFPPLEQ